jgi:hypothetical protein
MKGDVILSIPEEVSEQPYGPITLVEYAAAKYTKYQKASDSKKDTLYRSGK